MDDKTLKPEIIDEELDTTEEGEELEAVEELETADESETTEESEAVNDETESQDSEEPEAVEDTEVIDIDENLMELPMIPLRGLSVFPNMVLHFDIGREKSINALEKAMIMNQHIFLSSQMDEALDLPTTEDFYKIGVIGKIKQMLKLPGDTIRVLVEGLTRAVIEDVLFEVPYFKVRIRKIPDPVISSDPEFEALRRAVLTSFDEYVSANKSIPSEVFASAVSIEEPGQLADMIAGHIDIKLEEKQVLLELFDPKLRLAKLNEILRNEIQVLTIEQEISEKVKESMNQNQRDYYLREQMRVIREELGGMDELDEEIETFRNKLDSIALEEKVREKIEKEIDRFSKMQPSSAEAVVSRTYIETVLELPWNDESEDNIDINRAEEVLNAEHYGMEKVKERVLEYLAVMHLSEGIKGPILCLVGPPGVGKTSIAKSIANSIGREFVRMSLGGVRDEAEIRGHRRTYIGAIPGRIISAIKDVGVNNPVFLFDEVDKLGADYKGDPASALLEVLDPEQNKDFTDHYLEVPFDLSKVMFVTTANSTSTIPRPLLDRMEIIEVSGYTEEDKVHIAENYLVPKQIKENGLTKSKISFNEAGIRTIINYYTRESGVRNLEREIGNICRKVAKNIVAGETKKANIGPKKVQELLGKKKVRYDLIKGETEVGVTTGLAWTAVGGDTLFIETAALPGTGKVQLTGQMGDVMQESARTGVSYIRSVAKELGIDEEFYKNLDIHIHIPEGAVPKDGPSAGVTMCSAIVSRLTNTPARKDIAMTGEITLTGKVLPVGGIREKVLAAHRAGVRKVLLPYENEIDIEEIPEVVRNEMEFVLLKHVKDVFGHIFVKEK